MKWFKGLLVVACVILNFSQSLSQGMTNYTFGEGIRFLAADSSFSLKFSARFQSLYEAAVNLDDYDVDDGFQIRRARLKFDGFAYSPKLAYKIELALSNSDIAGGEISQSGNTASIVLDAVVKWNFAGNWSLWFGQTKLPGNRERVISSQDLQFVDRSNLNAQFNLDRDAGIQVHYNSNRVNLAGAVSMGEGRNMIVEHAGGYNYTLRGEYLPFGKFTDEGDYVGSDLSREPNPRLSIGIAYNINNGATRERGQLGDFMPLPRDLVTWFADAHFKYRGWSSMLEYARRKAPDGPAILDDEGDFLTAFYTGEGLSWQAGYLFRNNFEVAGRYTNVRPEVATSQNRNVQYTLGVSRYFVGHSLKIQSDISFVREDTKDDTMVYRLQLELGF